MQNIKLTVTGIAALFAVTACSAQNSGAEGATQDSAEPKAAETSAKPPAACQDAEYRQLDFWVGEWDLTWTQADGTTGHGTNIITRSPFGDCVITENFDGAPTMAFKGMSVSTYSKPAKMWRQTWVDDQGGYFALHGGPQEDGSFALELDRFADNMPYLRMIWVDIEADSLVWRWQGKADATSEWTDRWVINYARKK